MEVWLEGVQQIHSNYSSPCSPFLPAPEEAPCCSQRHEPPVYPEEKEVKVPYLGAALTSWRPCLFCGNCGTCPYIKVLRIFSFIDGICIHFSAGPHDTSGSKQDAETRYREFQARITPKTKNAFLSHPDDNLEQSSTCWCCTRDTFNYFSIF